MIRIYKTCEFCRKILAENRYRIHTKNGKQSTNILYLGLFCDKCYETKVMKTMPEDKK